MLKDSKCPDGRLRRLSGCIHSASSCLVSGVLDLGASCRVGIDDVPSPSATPSCNWRLAAHKEETATAKARHFWICKEDWSKSFLCGGAAGYRTEINARQDPSMSAPSTLWACFYQPRPAYPSQLLQHLARKIQFPVLGTLPLLVGNRLVCQVAYIGSNHHIDLCNQGR
jgi:hypothetical protein